MRLGLAQQLDVALGARLDAERTGQAVEAPDGDARIEALDELAVDQRVAATRMEEEERRRPGGPQQAKRRRPGSARRRAGRRLGLDRAGSAKRSLTSSGRPARRASSAVTRSAAAAVAAKRVELWVTPIPGSPRTSAHTAWTRRSLASRGPTRARDRCGAWTGTGAEGEGEGPGAAEGAGAASSRVPTSQVETSAMLAPRSSSDGGRRTSKS